MGASLHDLMLTVGVGNHPEWFSEIPLPNWPMPHQLDTLKAYPWNDRYGDFSEPGTGKTYPAQVHAIMMAAMGNRVVFTTLPGLIPQFMEEFEVFFPGIGKRLKIEHMDCTATQKKKKEQQWDVEGWPDILVLSYDIYRLYNDKNPRKKIGNNLWKIRNINKIGTPEEYATSYFIEEGDDKGNPRFPKAQPYTKDGRQINVKNGTAKNPKQMLLKEHGYNVLFFDEGDALCGLESILSESVAEMSMRLKDEVAIYVMTGTPIPTKLHNAYGLIRLINPTAYLNKASFLRQHCEHEEFEIPLAGGKSKKIKQIVGYFDTEKIFESLWKNARRVQKRDVIPMPEPVISEVPVKLSGRHLKLYRQVINDRFAVLGDLVLAPDNSSALRHLALQLISCPSKFDPTLTECDELAKATGNLVESINPGPKRKLIIFAFYRQAIESLALQFAHRKVAIVYGGIPDRQAQVEKFQKDDECDTIIIQWVSGGAGLNLQVASYIIFYECPTSPKAAKQAIARADRNGQVNVVNVYFMRVKGTLSDKNFKALLANEESNNRAIKDRHDLLFELLG
jgi:SNF2 family DNA or RNA helicase